MDNRRNEPNLKLINMEQVEIEKIDWLLYPFIPFGKVTIVQGDPGEGKTTMVLQIIAKLTKGEAHYCDKIYNTHWLSPPFQWIPVRVSM